MIAETFNDTNQEDTKTRSVKHFRLRGFVPLWFVIGIIAVMLCYIGRGAMYFARLKARRRA